MKQKFYFVAALLLTVIVTSGLAAGVPEHAAYAIGTRANIRGLVPTVFEKNEGQFQKGIRFVARSENYSISLENDGISIYPNQRKRGAQGPSQDADLANPFRIEFLRSIAPARARWQGEEKLAARANYFLGSDRQNWHTNVPLFAGARWRDVMPGIDWIARSGSTGIELDFDVAPGADLRSVRFRVTGSGILERADNGDLIVERGAATMHLLAPSIYQSVAGLRVPVEGRYVIDADRAISFRVPHYDRSVPLIIDPSVSLSYTTFLGGSGADSASGVGLDGMGNVYIAGTCVNSGFPEASGTEIGPGGGADFFVAELNPNLQNAASLIYLTFIGGSGTEAGGELAVNAGGEVAIAGTTTSSNYPVTDGTTIGSSANALALTLLNTGGGSMVFSTLLAGNGSEGTQSGPSVAFEPSENIAVASDTTSTNLPVTVGAYQTVFGNGDTPTGSNDGFEAVYSNTGVLAYLTYLGIDGYTNLDGFAVPVQVGVTGIAADLLGNTYLAGFTSQPGSGFPTTNGFQTTYGGGAYDAFLMCINPKGLGSGDLVYSTFLGGSDSDQAFAVAVDGAIPANAYLAGTTQSSSIFTSPTISGYQTTLNGVANGFLAVVSQTTAGVASLEYATYFGGSESDSALAVNALAENAVYLAGNTTSPNFPPYQTLQAYSGTNDGFVAKFDTTQAAAASLLYSTLLGGRNAAQVNGVAATALGSVFVAGSTTSPDFPLAGNPQTGVQPICSSCQESPPLPDAFLVALAENATIGPIVSFNAPQLNFGNQLVGSANPPETSQITNAGTLPLAIGSVTIVGTNAGDFSQSDDCPIAPSLLAVGANCAITVTFSPSLAGSESAALSFADNAPGSPQSVNLNGTGEEPVASETPAIVAFGNQAVGTVNQQVVTLTNSGNLALSITNVILTGPDVAQFGYGGLDTCGNAPLQQGASCMVGVDFQPTMTGSFSAQLQFTDNTGNAPGSIQSIQVSGIGVTAAPGVSVAPAVLTFSSQVVGTTSGPQTISMTNTGSLAAQVSTISIAGSNAPEFAFASGSNCPIGGGTLAASASCNVNVAFTPSVTGSQSAVVLFADNASGSPQSVSLSGTGSSAVLTVSPSSLNFSSQTLEVQTVPQTVTLQNSGATAINISNIAIGGSNPTDFTQSNNCPATLNPSGQNNPHPSCTISIQFDPIAGGVLSATLLVTDNASGSPQSVPLSGTGLVPSISMSPSSLAFGPQAVGTPSPASPIGVTNSGNGGLAISGLAFSGADQMDFSATQNCGTTLAPGNSCQISVIFAPTAAGSRSAYLNVTDNSPNSPQIIPVTGDATNFSIGMQPGAPQTIVVSAGGTATYNLQVSPAGGFSGSVAITCTGAPQSAACAANPASVSVTGQTAVAFTVNVTTSAATSETNGDERSSRNDTGRRAPMVVAMIAILALAYITPLYFATNRGRRRARTFARGIALILFAWSAMTACGGGGQPNPDSQGTPAGTYTLTVTGTNQTATSTTSLTLQVQ